MHIFSASHVVSNIIIEFSKNDRVVLGSRLAACIHYGPRGKVHALASGGTLSATSPDVFTFGRNLDVFERRETLWRKACRIAVPDQSISFDVQDESFDARLMVSPSCD